MLHSRSVVQLGTDAIGFRIGRSVSGLLALGNRLTGGHMSRALSTPLQRFLFIAVSRCNALLAVLLATVVLGITGWLYPQSGLAPVLIGLCALLLLGMWYRLTPEASFLLSSVYGNQIRVHLPVASLAARDVVSFKTQTDKIIVLAMRVRAKTLQFESPLLVADSTCQHLVRSLKRAAAHHGADIVVEVKDLREVDAIGQGSLSRHAERYDLLREGRMATGQNGRLLTRKVLVRMRRK